MPAFSLKGTRRWSILSLSERTHGVSRMIAHVAQVAPQSINLEKVKKIEQFETVNSTLPTPGLSDDARFQQHWSVDLWRNYTFPANVRDEKLPISERAQALVGLLQEAVRKAGVFDSPQSLAYWTYHTTRMGFFASTGILGASYAQFMQQRQLRRSPNVATNPANPPNPGVSMDVRRLLSSGAYLVAAEALVMFHQDFQNIRKGIYKLPWDMTTPMHKQNRPSYVFDKVFRFVSEANKGLARRARGSPDPVWIDSSMYPAYFLNSWHYQSDGYLSDWSAQCYEVSTETLFIGRQDAMQRQCLVPIADFMKEKSNRDGHGMQMIDIACGTGRVATFIKDNYPKLGMSQLDLSPFYLQEARKNMDYWRSMRGGSNPEDSASSKDKFIHGAAESVAVPDASYDIVLSTYLFHELPEDSRQKAIREMYRICKPGGLVIFTDGNQLGDIPSKDDTRGGFQRFNEPNWGTHIAENYGKMFEETGLVPSTKLLASQSKVLTFRKPE